MSTTVRIKEETHRRLGELSEQTGLTQGALIEKALDEFERKQLFDAYDEAYRRLRADDEAWEQEKQERKLWDNTAGDGVEGEPQS